MKRIIDANNWFRRYMYSDKFLTVEGMIVDLASLTPDCLIWDGFNGNARRRAIYPNYKMNRKERDLDTDFATLNLIRNDLMPYLPAKSMYADGYEGDDVIAKFCRLNWQEEIEIISTDKDLAAIPNAKNPTVSDKFFSMIGQRRWIPLFKTLVGDPSDGIKGLQGFGMKSWDKLSAMDREELLLAFGTGVVPQRFEKIAENFAALKPMWDVVNFIDVPLNDIVEIDAKYDLEKIKEILKAKGVQ